MNIVQKIIKQLQFGVASRSVQEDDRRQEHIINILVVSSIIFSTLAVVLDIVFILLNGLELSNVTSSIVVLALFIGMYIASRRGHFRAVIAVFIICYLLIATALQLQYGVGLQQALLLHVFVIIMTGILSSTRMAFIMTGIITALLFLVHTLHMSGVVNPNLFWKDSKIVEQFDIVVFAITFLVIAVVSWLSNREIAQSLYRARTSEAALEQERDQLEVRVTQRTSQLEKVQQERIEQLRHFANFGRKTSGIIHDLRTPLTALTLTMGRLSNQLDSDDFTEKLSTLKDSAESAQYNMQRIEKLLQATNKQIKTESDTITFGVDEEIREVLLILHYRAKQLMVTITTNIETGLELKGHQLRFNQAITNIVNNALDAYAHLPTEQAYSTITIAGKRVNNTVILTISDNAGGIRKEHQAKIFTAFFTTKRSSGGTGLGLAIVKEVIERDFNGTIQVDSTESAGTTFTITL